MNTTKQRRTYTKEFKLEAVRLAEESSLPNAQVARNLGISEASLYQWRNKYSKNKEQAFKNTRSLSPEQQELKQLKLELIQVKEERDVLKKAVAYFAKNP
ncbi:MAG: transposase [SAR324 cluster bacterium]|nr:transposase [SAR324 cluster bacterium]